MKILIIEDEESLQKALYKGFCKLNYTADTASDGQEALDLFFSNTYALVVLDLNLPKLDGMDVLKEIRIDNKEIPVIILSARSEVTDKIAGLDEGANDYLAKPFHFSELEARVRALLRRNFKTSDTFIEIESAKIDTAAKKFYVMDNKDEGNEKESGTEKNKEIPLSKKEYGIIEYLFLRRGEAITPAELIEHIWESDSGDVFNSFKVHLCTLRKKIPEGIIKNIRGHGYYVE